MFGKIIALVAIVAVVASAEPCGFCGGYLPSAISGYGLNGDCGSRVLNVGYTVPVASAFPSCAPIAIPSSIFDASIATPASVTPVVSTPLVSSGISSSGLIGSGCYSGYGYGSTLNGCGNDVLATVC